MTVSFLKIKIVFLLILIAVFDSLGQAYVDSCNREVKIKEYERELIKEVCIPKGYIIYYIATETTDIDIDGDSLPDFIFDWAKKNRKEGDTSFITAYKMNLDSSYTLLKTFNNLLPIDLDSYGEPSKNPYYAALWWNCYNSSNPLRYVEFNKGSIELGIKTDPSAGIDFLYKYSRQKNNWILQNIQKYRDIQGEDRQYEPYPMPETEETIDDFSYEKYLCPESLIKE
jgi:hypothetical protein